MTASSLAPEKLGGYLGKTRPQLEKLFPDQLDDKLLSKTNPAVVHFFAGTEYRMSWLPDTLLFDLVDGKVVRVVLAFESDDKARARELRDRVTAVAKRGRPETDREGGRLGRGRLREHRGRAVDLTWRWPLTLTRWVAA